MTHGSPVFVVFGLFLLHNRSSSSTRVMRTTTRATCLAITREGGGEERKRKKGSEGIGRNEICPGKGREREGKRRSEQAALSVGTSQCSPLWREGLFSRACVLCYEWDCDYDSPGTRRARTSVQSPQRAPPRDGREETRGDQRRCIGSIKFRLAHPPPTRWMGGCAVIGRLVPCCRSRWGLFSENLVPPVTGTFNYRTQP